MAAPLRLKTRGDVAVLSVGGFGLAVADALIENGETREPGTDSAFAWPAPETRCLVVASWRPVPSLWKRADERAAEIGGCWLPVSLEHPIMKVGPMFTPGESPCFDCYRNRQFQHDASRHLTRMLEEAYDADDGLGPRAHLPHHARLAAAVSAPLIESALGGADDMRGVGMLISLTDLGVEPARVVPCHGCAVCGSARVRRDQTDAIIAAVADLRATASAVHGGVGPTSPEPAGVAR